MNSHADREVEESYRRRLLSLSPARRVRMACSMFQAAKAVASASLGNSVEDESELRAALFFRFYGGDFTAEERERIADRLREAPTAHRPARAR